MSKSFEPFFDMESLLDSDSFKGGFARKLLSYFNEITCIETSDIDCRCAYALDISDWGILAARLKAAHLSGAFGMSEWRGRTKVLFAVIAQKLDVEKALFEVHTCP